MTGYGEAEKACSLMDFKHLISSTGVVRVLETGNKHLQIESKDI